MLAAASFSTLALWPTSASRNRWFEMKWPHPTERNRASASVDQFQNLAIDRLGNLAVLRSDGPALFSTATVLSGFCKAKGLRKQLELVAILPIDFDRLAWSRDSAQTIALRQVVARQLV